MKFRIVAVGLALAMAVPALAAAEEKPPFKSEKDKISYSIGINIGSSFKEQSLDVDPEWVGKGIRDAVGGGKTLLTDAEVEQILTAFQQQMRAKVEAEMKTKAESNKKEGDSFLAENKKKSGVVTLPSGLQYKVITAGKGAKPKKTDNVTTHYRGTLINGTEFDSSIKRGQPANFPVDGVIPGWTEALQLMPVGSKWQLFVPADLAYGPRAVGGVIGPNSTLIFEVELLSINSPQSAE
jgi:FKBP-type peptidyl-prolyl cis-trans isomerase FklB